MMLRHNSFSDVYSSGVLIYDGYVVFTTIFYSFDGDGISISIKWGWYLNGMNIHNTMSHMVQTLDVRL